MFDAGQKPDENVFIRRMRTGRFRQLTVTGISILAGVLIACSLTPAQIGYFPYYAILALLLLSAILAFKQYYRVIRPISQMLKRIQGIENNVQADRFNIGRLYNQSDDEFACLAAGMEQLVEQLTEKARAANERALRHIAIVQATPFTFFTVSSSGKVFTIVKDHYNLVPLLALAVGKMPQASVWGEENLTRYQKAVQDTFENKGMRWFDMSFPATGNQPEHVLRATVTRLNDLSALVVMGDMPAIDKVVECMSAAKSPQVGRTQKYAALKHLAASIAHDGRNVFAALGNLTALNKQSTDPNVRDQTEIAEDAIRRGMNLMTELMQYAGEVKYHLQHAAAAETCSTLFTNPTLRALVPDNIKLIVEISEKPMPDIDADPSQAWKVPFNLVKNAVEAIGSTPGRIWLTAKSHVLTEMESRNFRCAGTMPLGPGVMTTIRDDGPGIEPSIIDKIFDPYISSKGSGRGLGLATVFAIIDAHGGAVRVTSRRSAGTMFEIFLPASRQSASDASAPTCADGACGDVLLVDDDPAILQTTGLILKTMTITAHPAANLDDALHTIRTLRNGRIGAAIVDAHLAQAKRLLTTLREEFPKTLLILSSGTNEESLHALIGSAHYDRFLVKPYAVADLRKALTPPPSNGIIQSSDAISR